MAEDLPYELEKRKSILIAMMGLDRLLSDVPVGYALPEWAPPSLGLYKDDLFYTFVCPDAQRLLDNPLLAYNLRMLELARSVTRWADYLRIAGLSKGDLHTWKVQTIIEKRILQNTDEAQDGDGFLYVAAKGYNGEFSTGDIRWRAELWEERLYEARWLIRRLRKAVERVLMAVSPEGIASRVEVAFDRQTASIDGVELALNDGEATYLLHLRDAGGEFVSGASIAEAEGVKQFNVFRVSQSLKKKLGRRSRILDVVKRRGGRLVLPMPRQRP